MRQAGVEVHLDTDGIHLLQASPPPATVVKSPGVPWDAPVVATPARAGIEVLGELEIGWRLVPNEFFAVTGTNGKTTTRRADRRHPPRRGRAGGRGRQRRHARVELAAGRARRPTPPSSARRRASSSRTAIGLRARGGGVPELRSTTISTVTARSSEYRDAKLRIFANQEPPDVAVLSAPGSTSTAPATVRARCGRRMRAAPGRRTPDGGRALMDATSAAARPAQPRRTRWRRPRCASSAASTRAAIGRALREFPGVPHRLGARRRDRRRRVRERLEGHQRERRGRVRCESFDGGVHVILGGSLKGGGFADAGAGGRRALPRPAT